MQRECKDTLITSAGSSFGKAAALRTLDAHDGHDGVNWRFRVENQAGEIFGLFAISDANQRYGFPVTARGQRFTFRVVEASSDNTGEVEFGMFT